MWARRSLKEWTEEHLLDVHQKTDKPIKKRFQGYSEYHVRVAVVKKCSKGIAYIDS